MVQESPGHTPVSDWANINNYLDKLDGEVWMYQLSLRRRDTYDLRASKPKGLMND